MARRKAVQNTISDRDEQVNSLLNIASDLESFPEFDGLFDRVRALVEDDADASALSARLDSLEAAIQHLSDILDGDL